MEIVAPEVGWTKVLSTEGPRTSGAPHGSCSPTIKYVRYVKRILFYNY